MQLRPQPATILVKLNIFDKLELDAYTSLMTAKTVAEFAAELRMSPESLLGQLRCAGVEKAGPEAPWTNADTYALLCFLKATHGAVDPDRKKITLVKGARTASPSVPETAETRRTRAILAEARIELLKRCIEVSVRGKRTVVVREGNGALTKLDVPEGCFDLEPTRKVLLVGSHISTSFYALIERSVSLVMAPRTLGKVISSYLRAVADRAVPDSQRGLCGSSGRTRQAKLVGAASDLIRFEHVYPACAAAISLN